MEKRVPWEQSLAWCLPRHTVTFLPSRMKVKRKISHTSRDRKSRTEVLEERPKSP